MRTCTVILLVVLAALQVRLWHVNFGTAGVQELKGQVEILGTQVADARLRNQALEAEVADLKSGLAAIEERARSDLGMIMEGETFYQILEDQDASSEKY